MKKSILQNQYNQLFFLYNKFNNRLTKHFSNGRFANFSKRQQAKLIARIERLKNQLAHLENYAKLTGAATLVSGLLLSNTVEAQIASNGDATRVNTNVYLDQSSPSIAHNAAGSYVVVWESYDETTGYEIFGQRFNADGTKPAINGGEFHINSYTNYDQKNPSVAMDNSGDFVVTWESYYQEYNENEIYAQRYDATGQKVGAEFRVNNTSQNDQKNASIGMTTNGDFIITWESYTSGNGIDIMMRRYNAAGATSGADIRVNNTTTGDQSDAAIAVNTSGAFIISWNSPGLFSDDDIHAQLYTNNGQKNGSEFTVNDFNSNNQQGSSVGMDENGNFVVAWTGQYEDGSGSGVYAKRFNSAGNVQSSQFRANTITNGDQNSPEVIMNTNGDFLIAWTSYELGYPDVFAQLYNNLGDMKGVNFLINNQTYGNQSYTTGFWNSNGEVIIAWQDDRFDGNNSDIYSNRLNNDKDPNLNIFTTAAKFGDKPFTITAPSNNTQGIKQYSINYGTCATINPSTGLLTITCAGSVDIMVTQAASTGYLADTASATVYIERADPYINVLKTGRRIGDEPFLPKIQTNYDGVLSYEIIGDNSVAYFDSNFGKIVPVGEGSVYLKVQAEGSGNYNAKIAYGTITIYENTVAPVATDDTLFIELEEIGTKAILENDFGNTADLSKFIDLNPSNSGIQNYFNKPSVGRFDIDTAGILTFTPFVGFLGTGSIEYTVFDEVNTESNVAKITIITQIAGKEPELKANNVITPNDDDQNDVLLIGYADINKTNKFWVLDENGTEVYYTTNYQNDWSGKDKHSKNLTTGVYFIIYKEFDDEGNETKVYRNYCQLAR